MGGYVELNQDFHEFLESMVRHDVCSLAIGGHTLGWIEIGLGPSGSASERCSGAKGSIDEVGAGRSPGIPQCAFPRGGASIDAGRVV